MNTKLRALLFFLFVGSHLCKGEQERIGEVLDEIKPISAEAYKFHVGKRIEATGRASASTNDWSKVRAGYPGVDGEVELRFLCVETSHDAAEITRLLASYISNGGLRVAAFRPADEEIQFSEYRTLLRFKNVVVDVVSDTGLNSEAIALIKSDIYRALLGWGGEKMGPQQGEAVIEASGQQMGIADGSAARAKSLAGEQAEPAVKSNWLYYILMIVGLLVVCLVGLLRNRMLKKR